MRKFILFAMVIFLFISSSAYAAEIKNAQSVSYLKAEVIQTGKIEFVTQASDLDITTYIPQEDDYQKIESIEVSKDFVYENDKFGNRQVKISWANPASTVNYQIKTIVSSKRKSAPSRNVYPEFLKPTELIQSADSEIGDLAKTIALYSKTDFEKIAALSRWVNQNIHYNLAYSNVNLSAKEVVRLREGVCDEFSILLLSFARNLGYYSGYTVGYVYGRGYTVSEGDWSPHGWVEVYGNEMNLIADPTWAQVGFTDATHIKFATLADAIYPEINVNLKAYYTIENPKITSNVKINILEAREEPLFDSSPKLLEEDLWKGYAVVKSDAKYDGCVMTKILRSSCTDKGKDFFEPVQKEEIIDFCKSRTIFSLFKIPDLEAGKSYLCNVSVGFLPENQKNIQITISPGTTGKAVLSVSQNSVLEGEKIKVSAPNSHIFTSEGDYAFGGVEFAAKRNFKIYSYNKGDLKEEEISVIKIKPIEFSISMNGTAYVGKPVHVSVTVTNKLSSDQTIKLKLVNQTETISLPSLSENTVNLTFIPQNIEDNLVQVFVTADSFSSSSSKILNVTEEKKPFEIEDVKGFFESIVNMIASLFSKILGFFR